MWTDEQRREYMCQWREKNKDKLRQYHRDYRARQKREKLECRPVKPKPKPPKEPKRPRPPEQLCWTCQKATGGCSWSACFRPIEGWTAKAVTRTRWFGDVCTKMDTYQIKSCPEYEEGRHG